MSAETYATNTLIRTLQIGDRTLTYCGLPIESVIQVTRFLDEDTAYRDAYFSRVKTVTCMACILLQFQQQAEAKT